MGGHLLSLDECMLEGVRSVRICRSAPHQPTSSTSLSLETVASCVLELEVELGERHYSSITLREVPTFLLEAFRVLRRRGLEVEGLFRKEGNWSRLKNIFPVYFGCVGIPKECTVHDICSMIKRFFRELKTPLFAHLETDLKSIVSGCEGEERREKLLDSVTKLPPSHLGTLAYLLRQLKYFGDHNEGHHMTVKNLSRVFAPTLFREGDLKYGLKKKKKNQKHSYTALLDNNELKITIINELIESAARVAVPRDPYMFSRRSFDLGSAKKAVLKTSASMRSSHTKLFTKNFFSHSTAPSGDENKGKRTETAKHKGREGCRSSSRVRDIFSSLSSLSTKMLRKAVSPNRLHSKRTLAGGDAVENVTSADLKDHCSESGVKFLSQSREIIVVTNVVDFINQEEEQLQTITFDNEEDEVKDQLSSSMLKPVSHDFDVLESQHQSRRESPRKHLTDKANMELVKGEPMICLDCWPASPPFKRPQISVELLSAPVQKGEEKRELSEKSPNTKVAKRNSSESNKDSNHVASSLEDYEVNKKIYRKRRHTAPLKLSSILKRNQPNTIATGLRNVPVRLRERRALTLSFRSSPEETDGRFDEVERRSEGLVFELNDSSQVSGNENVSINRPPLINATALLEQNRKESRRRCAKQKKGEGKNVDCANVKLFDLMPKSSKPLLSDVTNALDRIEREHRLILDKNSFCDVVGPQPSTSVISIGDSSLSLRAYESPSSSRVKTKKSPVRSLRKDSSLRASADSSELMKSHLADKIGGKVLVAHTSLCKKTSPERTARGLRSRFVIPIEKEEIGDDTFSQSSLYKKQILTRQKDDPQISRQFCGHARPSVAYIKHNNRGMVKRRVNQFAQLESQHVMESFSSRCILKINLSKSGSRFSDFFDSFCWMATCFQYLRSALDECMVENVMGARIYRSVPHLPTASSSLL